MPHSKSSNVVGLVKPTRRPGALEDLTLVLPKGVRLLPEYLDIREGSVAAFERAIACYEPCIARLAEAGVDLIHPEGAPPFMVLGYQKEAALIERWQTDYGVPIFTSGTNHIRALKALNVQRFVGVTYFTGAINAVFSRYFSAAGFGVMSMEGLDVPFDRVGQLPPDDVFSHIRQAVEKQPGAEAIYLLGSGWRVMDIIENIEHALGIPVIHPVTARCWEIQQRLAIHQPLKGYGRLLAQMPAG
jgi:maleate isomerase